MHIEIISNGLGAPSIYLLILAREGKIPATVSITADTGAENDRLWNTGERTTAREYWERVVEPLARDAGIAAYFERAVDEDGEPLPSLWDWTTSIIEGENIKPPKNESTAKNPLNLLKIPLYGSEGGRLSQNCTDRFKVAALYQTARRLGATTTRFAQGLHYGEVRRMKGVNGRMEGEYYTLNDIRSGKVVQWASHYYPMIDRREYRETARARLAALGIPYLETSECDDCPHKDWPRWSRTSPEVLARIAEREAAMSGQFFFTDKRIPLLEALPLMQQEHEAALRAGGMFDDTDFGCDEGAVCGV